MSEKDSSNRSAKVALDFLEELIWTITSKNSSVLRRGIDELRLIESDSRSRERLLRSKSARAGSSALLIGLLPQLLADEELFPANNHIEKFAREVFGVEISRWEKRSRYEMIGMLVMEVRLLPELKLKEIVRALERIATKSTALKKLKVDANEIGFSWNETIRRLSNL